MHREPPQEFQDRLTEAGGTNHYGEPLFKLVWSETETIRVGGYFGKDAFTGYRDMLMLQGEQCWAILVWEPAEMHGTPWRWYNEYVDEVSGLCDLGEFPYHGKYRLWQKLIHRDMVNGQLVTYRMEPNSFIIDVMLPMIKGWMRLTDEAKVAAMKQEHDLKEKEYLQMAKDSRDSHRVRRGSALVQKKVEFLEKHMREAMRIAAATGLGMKQASA